MIIEPEEVRLTVGPASGGEDAALLARVHRRVERLVKDFVGYDIEQATQVEILPSDSLLAGQYDRLVGYGPGGLNAYGTDTLFLRHVPVRSITSVEVDETARWAGTEVTIDPSAYWLEISKPGFSTSGKLRSGRGWPLASAAYPGYSVGGWPLTPSSVRVTYVGGWTTDELDDAAGVFPMAVLQATAMNYNQFVANRAATTTAGTGAINAETVDGQNFQYARAGLNHGLVIVLPESVQRMLMPHVNLMRKCLV